MYFTHNQLYNYLSREGSGWGLMTQWGEREFTRAAVKRVHERAMNNILTRDPLNVWKWYRPWEVVPALRAWQAPVGDWGVGIEIELGFGTYERAQQAARAVQNMKYITLDFEGGPAPIEATFPPCKYSTYGAKSQASRYLKMVGHLAASHSPTSIIGTHVNVSKGGRAGRPSQHRLQEVNSVLVRLNTELQTKYFGRRPYGYGYLRGFGVEWKLFNSSTDWRILRRYVDVAVALSDITYGSGVINQERVVAALETAYNKNKIKENN